MEFISMLFRMSYPTPLRGVVNNIVDILAKLANSDALYKSSMFFVVIFGFILIILNNIDILKSAIKNFKLNRISKSVGEKETAIENTVSLPLYLNILFIVLSILLVVLLFHQYFSHTVYIHHESYITLPVQMKESSEILKQCIPTIFNLDNFEGGAYRPRVLSFLVDYINVNALPVLNRLFPFWGMRLVFNVLVLLLSIAAMYVLLNDFLKAMPVGLKLFLSVFPLYFVNSQTFLPIFYRTSKALVIPLGLFILWYFLKNHEISFLKRGIPTVLLAWILLSLSTLYDEQLVAIVLFFFCLSLLYSFIKRKLSMNTVVFAAALVFYLFWHFCLGRYLFSIFTPHPFLKHQHGYSSFLSILKPDKIYDAVIFYYNLISNNFKVLLLILFFILGFSLVNKNMEGKVKICLIAIPVLLLSFLLVCANIFGHPALIILPGMKFSNYFAPALFLFYFASIYFSFNIFRFLPYKKIFAGIILLSLLTFVIDSRYHKDEYYSISINNGILNPFYGELDDRLIRFDSIIKEKNIEIKYIHCP
jgi:hypothetical protein